MPTTSLKLPDDLKQRAIDAATREGISPHAFMLRAIEHATAVADARARFVAEALAARDHALETGTGFDANEVHDYLKRRIAGEKGGKPKAKSWRA